MGAWWVLACHSGRGPGWWGSSLRLVTGVCVWTMSLWASIMDDHARHVIEGKGLGRGGEMPWARQAAAPRGRRRRRRRSHASPPPTVTRGRSGAHWKCAAPRRWGHGAPRWGRFDRRAVSGRQAGGGRAAGGRREAALSIPSPPAPLDDLIVAAANVGTYAQLGGPAGKGSPDGQGDGGASRGRANNRVPAV